MMAIEADDFENARQVPLDRAYGHKGTGNYKHNPHYNEIYNNFMQKPDKNCTDAELR